MLNSAMSPTGHKVEIFLDEKKVGIGEAILMDENFGIVISEID